MTAAYDPELIDRLVSEAMEDDAIFCADEPPCDCTVAGPPHAGCAMCNHREAYRDALERTQTNLAAMADQLEAARREVDAGNDKLRRLYNAMCGAMANWERPDPGDRNLSDAEWERVGKAQEAAWHEMKAVFDASPGVLYVDAYRAAKGKTW